MRPAICLAGLLPLVLALAGCHADQPRVNSTPVTVTSPSTATSSALPATSGSPTPSASARSSASSTPSPTASPAAPETGHDGNFTVYTSPDTADVRSPGAGYRVVFSENIARHGSRSLSSSADADRALALWQRAAGADALTTRGKGFGPAVRKLTAAMSTIGYGELSTRGAREELGLGEREGTRLDPYFTQVVGSGDRVKIINTGVHRTETSAASFVQGLHQEQPRLRVLGQQTQPGLHFGERDPEYRRFIDSNRQWRAAYEQAVARNGLRPAAIRSLRRLYSAHFVDAIADPVAEARAVWEVCRAQGAMSGDVQVDLRPFLDARTAAAFAFDQDALWFYSRGPGLTGSSLAHRAADPLLHDFFAAADDRLGGGSTAAVYRFAHDTELVPFAARLELPGSRQLPSPRSVYSWRTSDFRVAKVAPLAASIEWTVWRNAHGKVLLQVRQNERPTSLGTSCRAAITSGQFYAWTEAKRCLGSR